MSVDRFQNVELTKNAGRDQKRAFGKYLASAAISEQSLSVMVTSVTDTLLLYENVSITIYFNYHTYYINIEEISKLI